MTASSIRPSRRRSSTSRPRTVPTGSWRSNGCSRRRARHARLDALRLEARDVPATYSFQQGVDSGFGTYTGAQDTGLTQATPNTNRANDTSVLVDFTDPAPTTQSAPTSAMTTALFPTHELRPIRTRVY